MNNNGSVSCYFYDAAGERTVKLTSESEMVHVNGKKVGGNDAVTKFTAYVSPYFVVSNGGAYTKHIYAASQRIASKLGNEDGFGADPRRVEMAGGKKISDFQQGNVGERFKALGYEYSAPEKEKVEKDSTMDSEAEEKLIFFYHPDHLGSTSYVTDADGNIAQHVEYIPYGEVFVEERNSQFSTNFLFNAKELDNETGLYYYGARYLDPTGAMWLSVDPMWEKYAGMNPYNYCAGNPVKLVDPDGRDIVVYSKGENNEDIEYTFVTGDDGKGAFYDKNGNVYDKGEEFITDLTNALNTLNEGENGKDLVSYLEGRHDVKVKILPNKTNRNAGLKVYWNSKQNRLSQCKDISGGDERPAYVGLAHELAHSRDLIDGKINYDQWYRNAGEKAIPIAEQYATYIENLIRDEHKIPLRPYYNENDGEESSILKFNSNGSISARYYNHTFKQRKEYGRVTFY